MSTSTTKQKKDSLKEVQKSLKILNKQFEKLEKDFKKLEGLMKEKVAFESILKELGELRKKMNQIELDQTFRKVIPSQPFPSPSPFIPDITPSPWSNDSQKCSRCGVEWKGVMGYVCPNMDCPMQIKPMC